MTAAKDASVVVPGTRRLPLAPLADAALVEAFRGRAVANISDNMERLSAAVGLRHSHKGGTLAGTALTVRTRPGDNLAPTRRSTSCARATCW
jgi:regulator of RNase E activity RraA